MNLRLGLSLVMLVVGASRATASEPLDPYLWLEEVGGEQALDWVRAQNKISRTALEASPDFAPLYERLRAIYDSDARIPVVTQQGPWLYNFWRDAKHPRGLWRRATLAEYRKPRPHWHTVLDLDALAARENENWVWKGASCLYPAYQRCLLRLSRGGADAHVVREFDLGTGQFVKGGFELPEAKHSVVWRNLDSLLVATDLGPGSLTDSGYPRVVVQWQRGTPIGAAQRVYEAKTSDVAVDMEVFNEPGHSRELIQRAITFFSYEYFLRSGPYLARLDVPADAVVSLFRDQLILQLRSDWSEPGLGRGQLYPAGSLLAIPLVAFIEGSRRFETLFVPRPQVSLDSFSRTRDGLLLNTLDRVRGRVTALHFQRGRWTPSALRVPEFGQAAASALNGEQSNDYTLTVENFTTPTLLLGGTLGHKGQALLKQLPAFFEAQGLQITQREAVSRDGTAVPYFQVARAGLKADGRNPTLLYGYGGFEIALTPGYRAGVGAGWLERGAVYVLANIRGGGEFGPPWHQAATRENRQRAYEDFVAVAEDLHQRRITAPKHLGIQGGSNGGLLMGVMLTQRPELFGAVVCQVPLLDMRRYHRLLAGASWMSEYGNPDEPTDWAYLSRYSPYQNVRKDLKYPPTLLTTSTRDDRVHPGHARKMTARLLESGQPVLYYENIEGGHGGAANNQQKAYMDALAYTFLWQQLR